MSNVFAQKKKKKIQVICEKNVKILREKHMNIFGYKPASQILNYFKTFEEIQMLLIQKLKKINNNKTLKSPKIVFFYLKNPLFTQCSNVHIRMKFALM